MENENNPQITEGTTPVLKNTYVSKKDDKTQRQQQREHSKKMRERLYWVVPLLVVAGITVWLFTLPRKPVSPTVKGKNHIHANLSITINGKLFPIPGGIGIPGGGSTMHIPGAQKVIHTHVENDQLHIESVTGGALREDDTKVSTFFDIWGKKFSSTTILENSTLSGGMLEFKVNGKNNAEFEKYQMRDEDKLEIIFTNTQAQTNTLPTAPLATTTQPL